MFLLLKWHNFSVVHSTGTYDLTADSSAQEGTKIVIHLKSDCEQFCEESNVKGEYMTDY